MFSLQKKKKQKEKTKRKNFKKLLTKAVKIKSRQKPTKKGHQAYIT